MDIMDGSGNGHQTQRWVLCSTKSHCRRPRLVISWFHFGHGCWLQTKDHRWTPKPGTNSSFACWFWPLCPTLNVAHLLMNDIPSGEQTQGLLPMPELFACTDCGAVGEDVCFEMTPGHGMKPWWGFWSFEDGSKSQTTKHNIKHVYCMHFANTSKIQEYTLYIHVNDPMWDHQDNVPSYKLTNND